MSLELQTPASAISGFITGAGGPKKQDPQNRDRFYACELKWNGWFCKPSETLTWERSSETFATKVIPVSSWTPKLFDPLVLRYKLNLPVHISR